MVTHRVQVPAVPGDLQFAADRRYRRVGKVYYVERVGPAEGHHEGCVAKEPHGVDPLAAAHVADPSHLDQFGAVPGQHGDGRFGFLVEPPRGARGGRYSEVRVQLGHGELVQHVPGDGGRGQVLGG